MCTFKALPVQTFIHPVRYAASIINVRETMTKLNRNRRCLPTNKQYLKRWQKQNVWPNKKGHSGLTTSIAKQQNNPLNIQTTIYKHLLKFKNHLATVLFVDFVFPFQVCFFVVIVFVHTIIRVIYTYRVILTFFGINSYKKKNMPNMPIVFMFRLHRSDMSVVNNYWIDNLKQKSRQIDKQMFWKQLQVAFGHWNTYYPNYIGISD